MYFEGQKFNNSSFVFLVPFDLCFPAGAVSAAPNLKRLFIASKNSQGCYRKNKVVVELGLEDGDFGNFIFSMCDGAVGSKKMAANLTLLRKTGVVRDL